MADRGRNLMIAIGHIAASQRMLEGLLIEIFSILPSPADFEEFSRFMGMSPLLDRLK